MTRIYDAYCSSLRDLGFGEPLWEPEPGFRGQVECGDVGYITEGAFVRLFRATCPPDDPVNRFGVPDGFTVLNIPEDIILINNNFIEPQPICSRSVKCSTLSVGPQIHGVSVGYEFTCDSQVGAVSIPQHTVTSTRVERNDIFRRYIAENYMAWHAFARSRNRDVDPTDLLLVSGHVKTTAWVLAAFMEQGVKHSVYLSAQGVGVAEAGIGSFRQTSVIQRNGPKRDRHATPIDPTGQSAGDACDQCLFLRYYKVERRFKISWDPLKKIVAAAEPPDGKYFDDTEGSNACRIEDSQMLYDEDDLVMEVNEVPSTMQDTQNDDPVRQLLGYILKNSDATLAVASHDDISAVCPNTCNGSELGAWLEINRPSIALDSNRAGCITKGYGAIDNRSLGDIPSKVRTAPSTQPSTTMQVGCMPGTIYQTESSVLYEHSPSQILSQTAADLRPQATQYLNFDSPRLGMSTAPNVSLGLVPDGHLLETTSTFGSRYPTPGPARLDHTGIHIRKALGSGSSIPSSTSNRKSQPTLHTVLVPTRFVNNNAFSKGASTLKTVKNDKRPHGLVTAFLDQRDPYHPYKKRARTNTDNVGERRKEELKDKGKTNGPDISVWNNGYVYHRSINDRKIGLKISKEYALPEIVAHGLVTPNDVNELFKIFFAHLNCHAFVLDPVLHTPATTFNHCPPLFTVVCAVASRYHKAKTKIYPIAMHFAEHAAVKAFIAGYKSVELAQTFIILSSYGRRTRFWEDRSLLYTKAAIRIATDLDLHHFPSVKPVDEMQERHIMNRTRVWINCYNLDHSTAAHFGRPSTINEDSVIRESDYWYKISQYNYPGDMGLCAHTSLLRIVAKFHNDILSNPSHPTGPNARLDCSELILQYDEDLSYCCDSWTGRMSTETNMIDPICTFQASLIPFFTNYSRLVMYSLGFHRTIGRRDGVRLFVDKGFEAAKAVILSMVNSLAPSGFMRYAPESYFTCGTFASAFLLKLIKPEFMNYNVISKRRRDEILKLIQFLIEMLRSPEIAIDEQHAPRLHARFLAGQLSRYKRDSDNAMRSELQTKSPSIQYPQYLSVAAGQDLNASLRQFLSIILGAPGLSRDMHIRYKDAVCVSA